jgi:N-acetyl-anhydromuramyl-L-alanine amidase AmpD
MKALSLAAACMILAGGAHAQVGDLGKVFENVGLPAATPVPPAPPATGVAVDDDGTPLTPEEQRTNFAYGEVNNRLKAIIIGHGRRRKGRRKPPQVPNNGVTPADRVDDGKIRYIVIHSAMGTCQGSIDTMTRHHAAAHFMVCADGDVTRLVDIKNITLHVKNKEINDTSVGIETETGWDGSKERFTDADWDPETRWKMYSSLAWLIRAVAGEAKVPRDEQHILGHLQVDLGIPDAHTDPGPLFYSKVYPAFEARYPGQNMTPQKFLMMIVKDDTPPSIVRLQTAAGGMLRVREPNQSGVATVKLYRLGGAKPAPLRTWEAPERGLPPAHLDLPEPAEPGSYRVEAYDLVGNLTAAVFSVQPPGMSAPIAAGDTTVVPLQVVQ